MDDPQENGIFKVTTETGSVYLIDYDRLKWARVTKSHYSGHVRTAGGNLFGPPQITVGRTMDLYGNPLTPDASFRLIITSHVTKIEQISAEDIDSHALECFQDTSRETVH
jgi:hypothetical protein